MCICMNMYLCVYKLYMQLYHNIIENSIEGIQKNNDSAFAPKEQCERGSLDGHESAPMWV